MLALTLNHDLIIGNSRTMSTQNYRQIRSDLTALAEEANRNNYAIHFGQLDDLLEDYSLQLCLHHLTTCDRHEDLIFELCLMMRAIESSTRYNCIAIIIPVANQLRSFITR